MVSFLFRVSLSQKDIYVAAVSAAHSVCAKDYYIAIVSTIVETDKPEKECEPGLALLGTIAERYTL